MANALEVEHLWQAYRRDRRGALSRARSRWALKDISFSAESGEMLGIIGANGSGKTTLLRSIAGVLRPDKGRVSVAGRVTSVTDLAPGLDRDFSGREQMLITGVLFGLTRSDLRARQDDILALSGLDPDDLEQPMRTYSQGMALRLAVAVALNSSPKVAIIDDVLAAGDEDFLGRAFGRMDKLRRDGALGIIASHDLDLVSAHCDRVVLLDQGSLHFTGPPAAALEYRRRERAS
jgi:ABC-type polysaccharide/polyol phosphate transport system ATPase subunit